MRFRVGTKQQREEKVHVHILKLYDPIYLLVRGYGVSIPVNI